IRATQAKHEHTAARGEVLNTARIGITNVLTGDLQSFDTQPVADELDIALPYIGHRSQDPTSAGELDLQPVAARTELHQVVEETLHRKRAIARRKAGPRIQPVARSLG